jgi:2-isopropylmalate synthase
MKRISIYDSTLRDGAQAQGISYSVEDKVKIVERLDALGVHYIEAGNPGSNPKDLEFFERVRGMKLKNAKLIAFGATRKIGIKAEDDGNVRSILAAGTDAVAIFGKSWDYQVTEILRTQLDENLRMIGDTVRHLKQQGKEVVYDAEHFFDGYKANPDYALDPAAAARPAPTASPLRHQRRHLPRRHLRHHPQRRRAVQAPIGIHCHNDSEMAVANSVRAVQAGATQVQGTINGLGERCGNANLCSIIPNLQLKLGFECIPEAAMRDLTLVARAVSEIANMPHNEKAALCRRSRLRPQGRHAHRRGRQGSGFLRAHRPRPGRQQPARPDVGSRRAQHAAGAHQRHRPEPDQGFARDEAGSSTSLKELEHEGYQFEAAESSFDLVVRKMLGRYTPFFELVEFKVMVNEPAVNDINSSVIIKMRVGDQDRAHRGRGRRSGQRARQGRAQGAGAASTRPSAKSA